MLDNLGLHDIFERKELTYESLTREFLSSLICNISSNTASVVDTVQFRMFSIEYEYTIDYLTGLLGFPHGEGVVCEALIDSNWSTEAFQLWRNLTGHNIVSFEGNIASDIHNPTIRVC